MKVIQLFRHCIKPFWKLTVHFSMPFQWLLQDMLIILSVINCMKQKTALTDNYIPLSAILCKLRHCQA